MIEESATAMIYDVTTLEDGWDGTQEDGLALSWKYGGHLYQMTKRLDFVLEGKCWVQSLTDLTLKLRSEGLKLRELQFWGHGWTGAAYVGKDRLDIKDLEKRSSAEYLALLELKTVLADNALIWFRTCATFCGEPGHRFAETLSSIMNCKVAGHTHIIHAWQAGLHTLCPGQRPYWPVTEGIKTGSPDKPKDILWSMPFKSPNGINMFRSTVPKGW